MLITIISILIGVILGLVSDTGYKKLKRYTVEPYINEKGECIGYIKIYDKES